MNTLTTPYSDIISQLPAGAEVIFHQVEWEEYEELLDQVGHASGLRISYDQGTLKIMTLSAEHEKYARFVEQLVAVLKLRLRLNILSFGAATMKKSRRRKGLEPDACFYVQTAGALGHRMELDFEVDPPPDVAVEIDIQHDSLAKFPISAALGVNEIWRYDGRELTIHLLRHDHYVPAQQSQALPILNNEILTGLLSRLREQGEFQTLLAFEEWLRSVQ